MEINSNHSTYGAAFRQKPIFFMSGKETVAFFEGKLKKNMTLQEDTCTLGSNDTYRRQHTTYEVSDKKGRAFLDLDFLIKDETSSLKGNLSDKKDVDFYNFSIPFNRTIQNYFGVQIYMDMPEGCDYDLTLRQNNSKTSVNGNEAFPQTSMKVYLKTDDMLFSGGNGTGLSFYIKYAEESTDDNPVVIAKGIDENGKEFEEKININDIDLRNASYVEMSALEAYYDVDRGNSLSSFPQETGHMGLNERCDLISSFEKVIQDMNKLGKYDLQMFYDVAALTKSGRRFGSSVKNTYKIGEEFVT